jgi:hypothetical protein
MDGMKGNLSPLVAALGMLASPVLAEENPGTDADSREGQMVLDLVGGKILGAKIGMNEATARGALKANQIREITKVEYPGYFLLQSMDCLGLSFNFNGGKELNDIYTNSPKVVLSNGLKLGQSIAEFDAKLGKPESMKRLPSNIGVELVYPLGDLELGVIVLDTAPDVARALTLRKRG